MTTRRPTTRPQWDSLAAITLVSLIEDEFARAAGCARDHEDADDRPRPLGAPGEGSRAGSDPLPPCSRETPVTPPAPPSPNGARCRELTPIRQRRRRPHGAGRGLVHRQPDRAGARAGAGRGRARSQSAPRSRSPTTTRSSRCACSPRSTAPPMRRPTTWCCCGGSRTSSSATSIAWSNGDAEAYTRLLERRTALGEACRQLAGAAPGPVDRLRCTGADRLRARPPRSSELDRPGRAAASGEPALRRRRSARCRCRAAAAGGAAARPRHAGDVRPPQLVDVPPAATPTGSPTRWVARSPSLIACAARACRPRWWCSTATTRCGAACSSTTASAGCSAGDAFPGFAYRSFQIAAPAPPSSRRAAGAVASKNDAGRRSIDAFADVDGMVLTDDDIAARRVVVGAQAGRHRRASPTELNLGLDAFVFVDDSDYEMGAVHDAAADGVARCACPTTSRSCPTCSPSRAGSGRCGSPPTTESAPPGCIAETGRARRPRRRCRTTSSSPSLELRVT